MINRIKHSLSVRQLIKPQKGWAYFLILGALAVLGWMVYKERGILFSYPWKFRAEYLFLFAVFHTLAMLSQTMAWHLAITRLTGVRRIRLDFEIYTISLISRRIPSPIWYIGSRFALYPADLISPQVLTIVTGLELGLIGVAGVICYAIFLPFYSFSYSWPWQVVLGIGAGLVLILILRPGIVIDITNVLLKALKRSPVQAAISRKDLLVWIFFYLLTWILDGMSLYFWVISVIPNAPQITDIIGVSTISALVSYLAQFLPAGFALKEISMSAILGIWIPVSIGAAIAVGYRIVMILVELIMAFCLRMLVPARLPAPKKLEF